MKYCKDCRYYEWIMEYRNEPQCLHPKTMYDDKVHGPQTVACRVVRSPSHYGSICGIVGKLFEPKAPGPVPAKKKWWHL